MMGFLLNTHFSNSSAAPKELGPEEKKAALLHETIKHLYDRLKPWADSHGYYINIDQKTHLRVEPKIRHCGCTELLVEARYDDVNHEVNLHFDEEVYRFVPKHKDSQGHVISGHKEWQPAGAAIDCSEDQFLELVDIITDQMTSYYGVDNRHSENIFGWKMSATIALGILAGLAKEGCDKTKTVPVPADHTVPAQILDR